MITGDIHQYLKQKAPTLSIGAISADQMTLREDVAQLEKLGGACLHFDLMDGRFVPQLTVGPWYVSSVKTAMLKDVHLMVEEPLRFVEGCVKAGADMITVHPESTTHIHAVLQAIGSYQNANDPSRKIVRGLALNPSTPITILPELLALVDMVVVLAINPGFSGQTYLPQTASRVRLVREIARDSGREILVMIDGGVTGENIAEVGSAKADLVVSGSAIFKGEGPQQNLPAFTTALKS